MQTDDKSRTAAATTAEQTANLIAVRTSARPRLAIVLGSGFAEVAQSVERAIEIPYSELPGFHAPTAVGHPGKLLIGFIRKTPVVVMNGRMHYYEGHSMAAVTFPMRVFSALGIRNLLLTNAAGGINRSFKKGDFMLIRDHINLMGDNPLRGPKPPELERFVDMTTVYDNGLRAMAMEAAADCGVQLKQGVYLAVSGPSYETPAEIQAFLRLGADAVGMSTVPEALVARQCGMAVAGLSCISNMAAGLGETTLTPEDVLAVANSVSSAARKVVMEFAVRCGGADA